MVRFVGVGAALDPTDSLDPGRDWRAGDEVGFVESAGFVRCADIVEGVGFVGVGRPPIDALEPGDADFAGACGGPMDVLPEVLNLDFALESEVLAVVAGVPVRGVEAAELAEDMGFVGDLVGD